MYDSLVKTGKALFCRKILTTCAVSALAFTAGCGGGGSTSAPATSLALSASTYSVAEDGTSVDVTVSRTGTGAGAASIDYATADGSSSGASAGSDYTAASGTLEWVDGDTNAKTVTITITDDNQYEGDETVTITLSGVSGDSLGTSSATLTITEEDTPGTLAFATASKTVGVTETDATGVTATLTVSRGGTGSDGNVSVSYDTATGTAGSGDFTPVSSGTLSWTDGETADKTITVDITGDNASESAEALTVVLSSPQAVFLSSTDDTSTVTITDDDWVAVSGTVSAPGASIAFNGPGLLERMFASLFNSASAALTDLVSAVPGVTVEVYEVDASGAVIGGSLTTATTDGAGGFTLDAPEAVSAGSAASYIVRASGSTGELDSRISDTSALAVDPTTDATSDLIASTTSDLSTISDSEITNITETVAEMLDNITTSGASAADLSTNLIAEIANNEEANNIIASTASGGAICGTVTDSAGAGIANVRVVVRDFGNWVTRAKVKTDSAGDYCMNVPLQGDTDTFSGGALSGKYIVGAINRTGQTNNPLKSASEWWATGGVARTQFDAESITVDSTTSTYNSIDFQLADGARISGTVTTYDGGSPEGLKVSIRDYDTFVPIASARVKADGTYKVSIPDGSYVLEVANKTLNRAYASMVYGAPNTDVDNNRNTASRVTLNVTDGFVANFAVVAGNKLSGTVLDAPGGSPVPGVRVRVDITGHPTNGAATGADYGGTSSRLRTRKNGKYRVWVKPDIYATRSRGNASVSVDMNAGNVSGNDFTAEQGTVTGTIMDGSGNPVSQAKLFLYTVDTTDTASYVYSLVSQELSNSDGSFELFATTGSAYKLLVRLDEATSYASVVYTSTGGTTSIAGGDNISATTGSATAVGTITLPTTGVTTGAGILANGAGVLSGAVGNNAITGFAGGQRVEIRAASNNNTTRFFTARTRGDGSYSVPVPAATYQRVRIVGTNYDTIVINDSTTPTAVP